MAPGLTRRPECPHCPVRGRPPSDRSRQLGSNPARSAGAAARQIVHYGAGRRSFAALAVLIAVVCGVALWITLDGGDDETTVRWTLTSSPDRNRLELRAEYGGSSCSRFGSWTVDEADDEVAIRATAFIEGGDCTSDLVFEPHTVVLDQPLGDRRLVGCLGGDVNPDCRGVAEN